MNEQSSEEIADETSSEPDGDTPAGDSGYPEPEYSIKGMFLLAALYLPMGFFLWFFMASIVVFPAGLLSEWFLTGLFPDMFEGVEQLGFHLEIQTGIRMSEEVDGRVAALVTHINPMIYAWGIPLLFGLIMATPLGGWQRVRQCAIGFSCVIGIQVWGIVFETFRDLAFLLGPEAATAIRESWLSPTAIALCYQLGYLMLPAVTPVAAWILMNREFLEKVVLRHRKV